jgi:5-formyltetrahydrofolate cyclo-ligase
LRGKFVNDCLESRKRKVRYEFLSLRDRIEPVLASAYSNMIFARIRKLPAYENALTIMFYLSYGSEVVTDAMISSALGEGKIVAVPAIENPGDGMMKAVRITRIEDAYQSVYGIRQPEINADDVVGKAEIDLMFVPGIAFDNKGYRTGYGKGYFDRWLEGIPSNKTIGIAYDFQIADELPSGKHDLPVGMIVTEKRIIEIKKN